MRLVRFGGVGDEKPGLIDETGAVRDLSSFVPDIGPDALSPVGHAYLTALDQEALPVAPGAVRFGPCLAGIGKIVCVGSNYADGLNGSDKVPTRPPLDGLKAASSVAGGYDDIQLPPEARCLDYGVELAIAIGTRARRVPAEQALQHVGGYCVLNNLARWVGSKGSADPHRIGNSYDGFAPIGPWLVTPDEIDDPGRLSLRAWINGTLCQVGTTAAMIFDVAQVVSEVSHQMTLEAGDLITTGTPPGTSRGGSSGAFSGTSSGTGLTACLRPGDRIEVEIDGLGRQAARLVPFAA